MIRTLHRPVFNDTKDYMKITRELWVINVGIS